jgi:hypothetical protein
MAHGLGRPVQTWWQRSRVATLVGIAATATALTYAWHHYDTFDWGKFRHTFALIDHRWLLAGLALATLSFVGRTLRWQFMMRPEHSSFVKTLSATLAGFAAVVVLGRPAELIRPYLIATSQNSTLARQAAIWLLERLYDLLVILLLFGLGLAYTHSLDIGANSRIVPVFRVGGWVVAAGAAAAGAVLWALSRRREFCAQRLGVIGEVLPASMQERFQAILANFLEGTSAAGSSLSMAGCGVLALAEWALILVSIWCYFQSYPDTSGFRMLDVAAFWGFVAMGAVIQVPGVGGGMQIVSVFVLTELFKLPVETATGLALLIWAGTSLVAVPLAVPFLWFEGLGWREIRRLGKESGL